MTTRLRKYSRQQIRQKLAKESPHSKASLSQSVTIPNTWQERIYAMFKPYLFHNLSQPHIDLWNWVDAIDSHTTPRPFVALWPRGRGKSTHAEMATAYMLATGSRKYCLYVCETQDQADKHIATIQRMLESELVAQFYPDVGKPQMGKHGSRTWRRSMLTAANGATAEAIGLDKAIRGQKIDWTRPDLIVPDDIDAKHDTEAAVLKKQGTMTTSILPAGAENCAVLFVQNLVHAGSIAHKLSRQAGSEGAADYLANRVISGPHKAVEGLQYEFSADENGQLRWMITAGKSLWEGFTLDVCENEINREGPTAFELESQHEIDTDSELALLSTEILNATRVSTTPDLVRAAIAVDPSGGAGQCGIIGGGIASINGVRHGYTLLDHSTQKGTPSSQWGADVLIAFVSIKADCIFIERNFGGDMAKTNIQATKLVRGLDGTFRAAASNDIVFESENQAKRYAGEQTAVVLVLNGANVKVIEVNASRGKEVRAEPVSSLFQQGRCHHVGYFPELQKQWTQWIPGTKPSPDRLDSEVWLYTGLGMVEGQNNASYDDIANLGAVENFSNRWT